MHEISLVSFDWMRVSQRSTRGCICRYENEKVISCNMQKQANQKSKRKKAKIKQKISKEIKKKGFT